MFFWGGYLIFAELGVKDFKNFKDFKDLGDKGELPKGIGLSPFDSTSTLSTPPLYVADFQPSITASKSLIKQI